MEHSKEFYLSVIRIIEYLSGEDDISRQKGEDLAGIYWPEIGRMLHYDFNLGWFAYGGFHLSRRDRLPTFKDDVIHKIKQIDKTESDRNVDRKYKIKGIIYGRISLIVSILAFLLSLWVTVRQAGIF